MPELPEVETVRRGVVAELAGARIESVTATGARSLRRHGDPDGFARRVAGRRLDGARRRGKYVLIDLEGGDVLVVHLGMSGQLRVAAPGAAGARHAHVVLRFAGGRELRFVDPRTFGEVFVSRGLDGAGVPLELDHLGVDALDAGGAGPGRPRLAGLLAGRRTKLKPLLMDQHRIAGIGNMYADEILWRARLRFDRPAGDLGRGEVGRLHAALEGVLGAAIAARGSSLADEQYRDVHGRIGDYQRSHRVYDRVDRPCARCGTAIVRVRTGGRSTFLCPRCQP